MTPQRRFTISMLLGLGYAAMLALVLASGWYATLSMEKLRTITQDLYAHPFAVSNAAANMKGSLFQLRNHMLGAVFIRRGDADIQRISAEVDGFEVEVRGNLQVIKNNFLGDMRRVDALEVQFNEWAAIRAEILQATRQGNWRRAEYLVKQAGTPKFDAMRPNLDYVLAFATEKGGYFARDADGQAATLIKHMRVLVALAVAVLLLTWAAVWWRVKVLQRELNNLAAIDFLTGVPNRRQFMNLAQQEFLKSNRYHQTFAMVVVDLDFFKHINDTHGHQVGDRVLQTFSTECRKLLRDSDILGRIGGEEFAMVLPNVHQDAALAVLERVRLGVERLEIAAHEHTVVKVTASFGVAMFHAGSGSVEALMKAADQALYAAKQNGRNRICVHQPT